MFKFEWIDREVTTREKKLNVEINPPSLGCTADLVSGLFSSSSKKKISSSDKKTQKKRR